MLLLGWMQFKKYKNSIEPLLQCPNSWSWNSCAHNSSFLVLNEVWGLLFSIKVNPCKERSGAAFVSVVASDIMPCSVLISSYFSYRTRFWEWARFLTWISGLFFIWIWFKGWRRCIDVCSMIEDACFCPEFLLRVYGQPRFVVMFSSGFLQPTSKAFCKSLFS